MALKEKCAECGRSSKIVTLTDGVCNICRPVPVQQKHVDGVSVTKIRRYAAEEEAEEYVAKNPSPEAHKVVTKKATTKKPASKKVIHKK